MTYIQAIALYVASFGVYSLAFRGVFGAGPYATIAGFITALFFGIQAVCWWLKHRETTSKRRTTLGLCVLLVAACGPVVGDSHPDFAVVEGPPPSPPELPEAVDNLPLDYCGGPVYAPTEEALAGTTYAAAIWGMAMGCQIEVAAPGPLAEEAKNNGTAIEVKMVDRIEDKVVGRAWWKNDGEGHFLYALRMIVKRGLGNKFNDATFIHEMGHTLGHTGHTDAGAMTAWVNEASAITDNEVGTVCGLHACNL